MNLILHLSPEIEAKLLEQAALTGKAPEELALNALHEQLAVADHATSPLSAEEWVADLRQWVESHRRLPADADDSRASIYAS